MKKVALLVLAFLASCATPAPQLLSADAVFDAVTVESDEFSRTTMFDAPQGGEDRGPGNGARWFLRAVRSDEVPTKFGYVLRLYRYSSDWSFYGSAWAEGGKSLKVERTDSDVWSGQCREHYSVSLSREDLDRAARDGMRIKVSGRRGEWVLGFPAYYAAGFLARVDGARPAAPAK